MYRFLLPKSRRVIASPTSGRVPSSYFGALVLGSTAIEWSCKYFLKKVEIHSIKVSGDLVRIIDRVGSRRAK